MNTPDPSLDLVLERTVDVPVELVWKAWTTPELLMQWFTPKPWKTVECTIDLKPGGRFATTMQSPEGENHPNEGCYLEVVENRKLIWTSALHAGYRPTLEMGGDHCGAFQFSAMIEMEPHGDGTKYTATAIHGDAEASKKHLDMGFHDGWGAAFDQLVELMKR